MDIFTHRNLHLAPYKIDEMRRLVNEWDPIGVAPSENDIFDEYDFYLEPSLLLLKQGATTAEVDNYINS